MSLRDILRRIYRKFSPVMQHGTGNVISIKSKLKKFNVDVNGDNNDIYIAPNCHITNGVVFISGNNNKLFIEEGARIYGPLRIDMKDSATVIIRKGGRLRGAHIVAESGIVEYGEDSMTSYGVIIRNADSHPIYDTNSGERLNTPQDVVMGRHVWLAQNATILKGVTIGDNSIIGTGSIVTKDCPQNCVMAGNPAKVIKENVRWER